MDRSKMHKEFKLLMDKTGEGGAPSFLASEIDTFLNIAQEAFISKRTYGNNVRRTGFEETQKRRDDLRTLVVSTALGSDAIITDTDIKPNSTRLKLPEGYRHSVSEEAEVLFEGFTRRVAVTPITHDRYSKIINDPFNMPNKNSVLRLDVSNDEGDMAVELIVGEGCSLNKYFLRYIKNPVEIAEDVSCILPTHTHKEIVRMAVVDALENIEHPRYQSSKIELNEIE